MLEDLVVLAGLGCTAEEGNPGVDRSLGVGHNLEAHRTAVVVAGHTVAEVAGRIAAAEGGHRRSNRQRDFGHLERHRQALP